MSNAYNRNLLKIEQVKDFRSWLRLAGIEHRDGKGEFQVLQVRTAPDCWAAINRNAKNILSTHPDLKPLINSFLNSLINSFLNSNSIYPAMPAAYVPDYKGEKSFQNFHRSLCERFGAVHDPVDWWRDTVSLEEHIASLIAKPAPAPTEQFLDDLRDDFAMHALNGLLSNHNLLQLHPNTGRAIGPKTPELVARDAYRFADAMLIARTVKS